MSRCLASHKFPCSLIGLQSETHNRNHTTIRSMMTVAKNLPQPKNSSCQLQISDSDVMLIYVKTTALLKRQWYVTENVASPVFCHSGDWTSWRYRPSGQRFYVFLGAGSQWTTGKTNECLPSACTRQLVKMTIKEIETMQPKSPAFQFSVRVWPVKIQNATRHKTRRQLTNCNTVFT